MSTCYLFDPPITEAQLSKAILELNYKKDMTVEEATETHYPITDGTSYVWFTINPQCVTAEKFGGNNDEIVYAIADELGVSAWCEHDDEFHQLLDADSEGEHGDFIRLTIDDIEQMAEHVEVIDLNPTKD